MIRVLRYLVDLVKWTDNQNFFFHNLDRQNYFTNRIFFGKNNWRLEIRNVEKRGKNANFLLFSTYYPQESSHINLQRIWTLNWFMSPFWRQNGIYGMAVLGLGRLSFALYHKWYFIRRDNHLYHFCLIPSEIKNPKHIISNNHLCFNCWFCICVYLSVVCFGITSYRVFLRVVFELHDYNITVLLLVVKPAPASLSL